MQYRHLGSSGLKVSALSFGSWVTFGNQVDTELAVDCMKTAFDAGCNFFDNAEVYAQGQSETVMGEALQKLGWDRSEYVVSTKIFWGGKGPNQRGLSRKHILEGTEKAMRRLRVDYVDLVFCHRPDRDTPIEETVRAMSHLVDSGKALYWGTSEWSAEQLMDAYRVAREQRLVPPTMEQPEYSMFHRERVEKEYAPLYEKIGLGTTIWSPLASGILTGKYGKGIPAGSRATLPGYEWLRAKFEDDVAKERIAKTEKLRPVASELGCSLAQLALAWCLKFNGVSTVITGASKVSQVEENMKAMAVVDQLDATVMEKIEALLDNAPPPEPNYRDW